jgi:hypothetical protein
VSDIWYYADAAEQVGPLTLQELRQKLAAFSNANDVLVWCNRFTDWKPARDVTELVAEYSTGTQGQKGSKAPPTQIERMLADARLRLVEIGTRNRLVHTPRGGKRTRSLPILNADADGLFEAIARSGKAIGFQATNSGRHLELYDDELLNAAGRAGRAGDSSQGFVLIVPSKVMDFENRTNQIHSYWSDLRAIFSQSDQCLEIDDPFQDLLDQIHVSSSIVTPAAQYFLSRLPRGSDFDEGGGDGPAKRLLSRSFGAYRARMRSDEEWINSRTAAAIQLRNADPSITNTWIDSIAAASGVSTDILTRLTRSLVGSAGSTLPTTDAWRDWLLNWLRVNPGDLTLLIRRESLEGMFGSSYKGLATPEEKGTFAVPILASLLSKWMGGATLASIEAAFGTRADRLGHCEKAREFVLRIIPELAYLYGLLPQIYAALFSTDPIPPIALATIGSVVREGFDSTEKLALRQVRGRGLNRVAVHREFAQIARYLAQPQGVEPFAGVIERVRSAVDLYDFVNN